MDDFSVCEHCCSDNELRAEILHRGTRLDAPCAVCGKTGLSLPASDRQVKRIFRALVRLHYSEWEYNSHLGGDSLQTLVRRDSSIFSLGERIDESAFEDVFLTMADTWYPESDEDISLGGGYWDGGVLVALTEAWHASADALVRKSLTCSPFEAEPEVLALLDTMRHDITHELPAGTRLSRARLGVKRRYRNRLKALRSGVLRLYERLKAD